jgi:hypothetical protein
MQQLTWAKKFPVAPDPKLCLAGSNLKQEQTFSVSHVRAHACLRKPPETQPTADQRPPGSFNSNEPTAPKNYVHVHIRTTSPKILGGNHDPF